MVDLISIISRFPKRFFFYNTSVHTYPTQCHTHTLCIPHMYFSISLHHCSERHPSPHGFRHKPLRLLNQDFQIQYSMFQSSVSTVGRYIRWRHFFDIARRRCPRETSCLQLHLSCTAFLTVFPSLIFVDPYIWQ